MGVWCGVSVWCVASVVCCELGVSVVWCVREDREESPFEEFLCVDNSTWKCDGERVWACGVV